MRQLIFYLVIFPFGLFAQLRYNSSFDEQSPVLAPDGASLYFTVSGHPDNAGGKRDPGDIWFSVRMSDGWTRPQPVPGLNNEAYNSVAGFSSNGDQVYLYGHYQQDGTASNSQGISVSNRTGAGWSRPENIYIPYFTNRSVGTGAHLNSQSNVLVYSAAAPTSLGAEDLFMSILTAEGWTEPFRLGPEINSEFQEVAPFLSPDGRTLYFSSNRPGTRGSFDVFQSERQDDTWKNWSKAMPLPGALNTESRELYFSTSGSGILYTSTRDSDGYGDIRMVAQSNVVPAAEDISPKKPEPTPVIPQIPETTDKRPDRGMIRVQGLIVSAEKGTPLPASLTVKTDLEKQLKADSAGYFSFEVFKEDNVTLEADYKGFISRSQKVDLAQAKRQVVEVKMSLMPATLGTVVTLSNVLFHQSSAYLLEESFTELDVLVTFLKLNPDIRIELAGHTDNRGDRNLNLRLSKERVKKVKSYLESKGIEGSRIIGKGYGGTKPVGDNRTEEGRRLNRRVEFTIIK